MINRELLETHLEEFDKGVATFEVTGISSRIAELHLVHIGVKGLNLAFVLLHIRRVDFLGNLNFLILHLHFIVQFFESLAADRVIERGEVYMMFIDYAAILGKPLEILLAHHEFVRAMIAAAAFLRGNIYREVHLNLVVRVILFAVSLWALAGYGTIVRQVQVELCFAITLHFALRELGDAGSRHIAVSKHFLFIKSDLLKIFLHQLDACCFEVALHIVLRTLSYLHVHKLLEWELEDAFH